VTNFIKLSAALFALTLAAAGVRAQNAAPVISSLAPAQGPVRALITIHGSGFTPTGNDVHFGKIGGTPNLPSPDGKIVTFVIPWTLNPCGFRPANLPCPQFRMVVKPGRYDIHVVNANGTSNAVTFTVVGN
jgi:IPT/TIG domain